METTKVVDGNIEITTTSDTKIETKSNEDLIGEKAEAQTKVDHLIIDLAEAQAKVDAIDAKIALLTVVTPK